MLTDERLLSVYRTVPTAYQTASWSNLKDTNFPGVENENVKLLIGCNAPGVHETKKIGIGKANEPFIT